MKVNMNDLRQRFESEDESQHEETHSLRTNCMAHSLQLVVKDGLNALEV